jgi:hypothetical protein
VPKPVEVVEKISVNGRCEEVVRRVGVDEVAARRKLVHGCANKNRLRLWRQGHGGRRRSGSCRWRLSYSGRRCSGIKPGFSAWICAASLVGEEDFVGVDDDHGR